jgi:hypothetical protein
MFSCLKQSNGRKTGGEFRFPGDIPAIVTERTTILSGFSTVKNWKMHQKTYGTDLHARKVSVT